MKKGIAVDTRAEVETTGQATQFRPLVKKPFAQAAHATPVKAALHPDASDVLRHPGQRSLAGSGQRVNCSAEAPVDGTQ